MTKLLITMDGPAGTGKSSVSREVARLLDLPHLDTGAFYRAAGIAADAAGVDMNDEPAVARAVRDSDMDQIEDVMILDGSDVSQAIRTPAATVASSVVSAHPTVRAILVDRQREWVARRGGRAVVDGRDIGSVVFPDADLKIYLDATPEVRAARRSAETGEAISAVLEEINARDARDSTRPASPLTVPVGAVVIDTSDMGMNDVVSKILDLARRAEG